jgi:hypothetical protein
MDNPVTERKAIIEAWAHLMEDDPMMRLGLALCGVILTAGTAAANSYWVVGNRATGRCDIVRSNPVIDGDIFFGDGPYTSKKDAKIAIRTISFCPKDLPKKKDKDQDNAED